MARRQNPNEGSGLVVLGAAALAGWWFLQQRQPSTKISAPAIPSGADPRTGQYGQQTGQGYPPMTPVRANYLLNPLNAARSTQVCSAQVLQMQAQHAAQPTTREGAGQAGPTGAWVYTTVTLPVKPCKTGNGAGGWGNGGH